MFEEFYEMYESEEQEVVALINRCIGGGYNSRGGFWEMAATTLGMVFCGTGEVSAKEDRLDWPVADEERDGEKGWGRFGREQICRLKIRKMKEEWAKDLAARTWCISEVVKADEDCPELQAILDDVKVKRSCPHPLPASAMKKIGLAACRLRNMGQCHAGVCGKGASQACQRVAFSG